MWKTLKIGLIFAALVWLVANASLARASHYGEFRPNYILSDEEMADASSMTLEEIEDFLTNGPGKTGILGTYITNDIDGKRRPSAEIIYNASQRHRINPKVILTLLQREKSLLTDPNPEPHQLNCAMGYSCGDYARLVGFVPHFGGLAIQIDRAAWRLRYFLDRPWESRHRRGIVSETLVNRKDRKIIGLFNINRRVRPQNIATAALYNYAPHLWDSFLFWQLWQKWGFGSKDPLEGRVVKTKGSPDIWLIERGERKLFPTPAIFRSFFPEKIQTISQETLASYEVDQPLDFPNWSLLRTPEGGVYFLADGKKRPIVSESVFKAVGFRQDEVIPTSWEELERFPSDKPVVSAYPVGALLQDKLTGSVWYVEDEKRFPIWSAEILEANFPYQPIIQVSSKILDKFTEDSPMVFKDETLVKLPDSSAVYVISQGQRRPIESQEVFEALGYEWQAVFEVPDTILNLHPVGTMVDSTEIGELRIATF